MWIPLFNKKEILITENLLEFMGFYKEPDAHPNRVNVKNGYDLHKFIEFLKNNDIKFEQAK